jgi:hypothetical protein
MSPLRILGLALVAVATTLVAPDIGGAASIPSPACNGGGCGGWFRSNVTVTWSYDPAGVASAPGCGATTITEDTAGTPVTCTLNYTGGGGTFNSVSVAKDSSPPSVSPSFSRSPDANGWYTSPVAVSFSGDGGPSGISSCTSGTYSGPDSGDAKVTGSCTDGAGNTGSTTVSIHYDGTAPTVTPAPERPPDADGWYNHPVKVAFTGQDGGSGLADCTAPVTYGGPDGNPAKVVGQCRDAVGHVSAPVAFELRYDHTKPARPALEVRRTDGAVILSWTKPADAVRALVVRAPGRKGKKPGLVYAGNGLRLVDRSARAPTKYWYEVRVYDQAGNVASRTLAVQPATGILAPTAGAAVRRAPLVRWAPVRKARFYNVQLWRGRTKILTTWPVTPRLRLQDTWTFAGRTQHLQNGRYQLYVWPAFGTLSAPRYGAPVGRVGFTVRRR